MASLTKLRQIFNEVQDCTRQTYSTRIQEALDAIAEDPCFLAIFHSVLACKKMGLPDRVLSFIKRIFEGLHKNNQESLERIFYYLLGFVDSKSNGCRRHALHLLGIILEITKYPLPLDVLQCISERLFDRDAGVRKGAVRICLWYRESELGKDLRLVGVLKDLIRFDQSSDIRRMCLMGISISPMTINCIVERCTDISLSVRKSFWGECFEKLPICELSAPQRVYLMRSAVVEREFDAKSIFLRIVKMLGVAEFSDYFYCEDRVFTDVIEDYLKFNGEELHLTRFTPGYVWMMGVYYRLREENVGRDNLNMMDLEEFLDIIAERCTALENNDKKTEDVKTLIGLFRLLSFYDLFDEQSRKKVLKIVNKLLTKCNVKDVVDEVIVLCKRICHTDITPFLGSIVKKLRGTPLCYTVSGCIMKHLPYGELHEAIFQEIAIPNLNESLEIIYWYFFHCPSENLKELLLSFLPNTRAIHYSIDLVLTGHVEVDAILPTIESLLFKFDEAVAIPATKLLLSQKMKGAEYFKYLLQIFYLTENESIQQYLTVFFYEYFAHDAFPLIDVFCDVIQLITDNYRIFADQAFFWISNSETQNGLQWLFLRICGCILRNNEELKNRRYFFFILDRIPIISTWEPVLTKKIIYLFGQIIKTKPREQTQSILASLLEIDDGIPLGAEEYILLRNELGTIPCMQ